MYLILICIKGIVHPKFCHHLLDELYWVCVYVLVGQLLVQQLSLQPAVGFSLLHQFSLCVSVLNVPSARLFLGLVQLPLQHTDPLSHLQTHTTFRPEDQHMRWVIYRHTLTNFRPEDQNTPFSQFILQENIGSLITCSITNDNYENKTCIGTNTKNIWKDKCKY